MTFHIVPTPATKNLARDMIHTARHECAADAVIEHLGDLRQSQIPALVALLLKAAAAEPKAIALVTEKVPPIRPKQCADCRRSITGDPRRGLCRSCYDRNRYDGTIDRFPRRLRDRTAAA